MKMILHKIAKYYGPGDRETARRYEENPAKAGLGIGAMIGTLNGILVILATAIHLPQAISPSMFLLALVWGFFIGMFVGGLMGLACQWKKKPRGFLLAGITLTEVVFLILAGLLTVLEFFI